MTSAQQTQRERVVFHAQLSEVRIAPTSDVSTPKAKPSVPKSGTETSPTAAPQQADPKIVEMLLVNISKTLNSYAASQQLQTDQIKTQAVGLATTLARHIVGKSIELGDYDVQPLIDDAIARLGHSENVAVRLHPDDLQAIELNDGTSSLGSQLQLIADPKLARGSCIATSGQRELVSTIEQRLDDVERLVKKELENA